MPDVFFTCFATMKVNVTPENDETEGPPNKSMHASGISAARSLRSATPTPRRVISDVRWTMRTFAVIIIAATTCGCLASGGSSGRRAIVDDVMGKPPFVSDYGVVAVDGEPVKRCKDPFVTVIPLVELEPGTHTLTVRLADEDGNKSTVTGNFEAGKSYRVKSEHGKLSIVERNDDGEQSAGDRP